MIHRSRDVEEVRRATAILTLMDDVDVSETAARLCAGRSSVYRWAVWYNEGGIDALRSAPRGRTQWTVTEPLVTALQALLSQTPRALGYLRSTWSSELLAQALKARHALAVLFLALLRALRAAYRRARRIILILDNYIIHRSQLTLRWPAGNRKFRLLFQPAYHPWVNTIERLWKQLHDTVTRNHQCRSVTTLMQDVTRFLHAVQPFPGAGHGVAHFGSAI